ncbi:MAG: ATP-binding protein [Balneolaceae bacterium]
MRYSIFIIFLLFNSCSGFEFNEQNIHVEHGILDLRSYSFVESGALDLSGEWELYPGFHYLNERDFLENSPVYFPVPTGWDSNIGQEKGIPRAGKGTYRLKILFGPDHLDKIIGFNIGTISSSYELYVNGKKIHEEGKISESNFDAKLNSTVVFSQNQSEETEIVFLVSDYLFGSGGFWDKLSMGTYRQINDHRQKQVSIDLLILGVLLIMAVYHFGIYLLRRNDLSALLFGLINLILAIRILTGGLRLINLFAENLPWNFLIRVEFLTFYILVPVFYHFYLYLFPKDFSRKLNIPVYLVAGIFSIPVVFFEIPIFRLFTEYYQIFTLIILLYGIYGLILIVIRGRVGSKTLTISSLILFVTVVNDILYAREVFFYFGYIAHYGLIAFIFFQAFLLSKRFSDAFKESERLSKSLYLSNKDKKELKKAKQQAESANTRLIGIIDELQSFSYSVSHDLRAPLRGIDGFSYMLKESYGDILDEKGLEYLNRIRTSAQKMGSSIDEVIELARVSRSELKPMEVNLSAMAHSIVNRLQADETGRNAEIIIQPDMVDYADPTLIEMALQNLLENAWKYSGKNDFTKIEFGSVEDGNFKGYFIRDNGIGFDNKYAEDIFTPFKRLHTESEFEGTGIGLATVKRIIHRHFGTIHAEGELNRGATFYFTLKAEFPRK